MQFTCLSKNVAWLVLFGGFLACSSQSPGGAGGGGSGGDGGGGGGSEGGSSEGGAGNPGSSAGGNPGMGGGGGAGGGVPMGGSGGTPMAMTGGAPGSGGAAPSAGAPVWCTSKTNRPLTWNGTHGTDTLKMADVKTDPSKSPSAAPKGMMKNDIGATYYLPSQYETAADGKVAFAVMFGNFANATSGDYKWQTVLDNLIHSKDIPPLVMAFSTTNINNPSAAGTAKNTFTTLFNAAKAKYPKLSGDAAWHLIAGQSTSGAVAFDAVWDNPTVIGNLIAGSGSFVCFMPKSGGSNDGYAKLIKETAAKKIRVSMSVGKCDIFGSLGDRIAAGCMGSAAGGDIDSSPCGATWPDVNKDVKAALDSKAYESQLLITSFGHSDQTWALWIGDQLRWIFRPITCGG